MGRNGRTDGTVALTEGIRARGGCSSAKGNALVPPPVSRPPRQDPVKPCTTRQNRGSAVLIFIFRFDTMSFEFSALLPPFCFL